jgi:hypothetical protein
MSLICYEFTILFVTNMSLICAAGALNPCGHYVSGMTDLDIVAAALSEMQTFCAKTGCFSSPITQEMVVDGKMSPGMHLLQLHFIATDVLTLKLMLCFHHLQLHGGKCSVTGHLHFRSLQ